MGEPPAVRLRLFDYWRLTRGNDEVDVPPRSRRLLALLALRGRQNRGRLAGTLWPEVDELRAQCSLRATLSDVDRRVPRLLGKYHGDVYLDDSLAVDIDQFRRQAGDVLAGEPPELSLTFDRSILAIGELLPGWYDDWVIVERERIYQLRLHVLEALAQHLAERGDHARAIYVALAAVAVDPLRESARRTVIRVHVAEGNITEAIREYEQFRALLNDELGVEPTEHITDLVRRITARSRV